MHSIMRPGVIFVHIFYVYDMSSNFINWAQILSSQNQVSETVSSVTQFPKAQ